jgi:hypothetical protein
MEKIKHTEEENGIESEKTLDRWTWTRTIAAAATSRSRMDIPRRRRRSEHRNAPQ